MLEWAANLSRTTGRASPKQWIAHSGYAAATAPSACTSNHSRIAPTYRNLRCLGRVVKVSSHVIAGAANSSWSTPFWIRLSLSLCDGNLAAMVSLVAITADAISAVRASRRSTVALLRSLGYALWSSTQSYTTGAPSSRRALGTNGRYVSMMPGSAVQLSLIHISEPTRLGMISYAVF